MVTTSRLNVQLARVIQEEHRGPDRSPTGRIICSSRSTSTGITVPALAPATGPVGLASWGIWLNSSAGWRPQFLRGGKQLPLLKAQARCDRRRDRTTRNEKSEAFTT